MLFPEVFSGGLTEGRCQPPPHPLKEVTSGRDHQRKLRLHAAACLVHLKDEAGAE